VTSSNPDGSRQLRSLAGGLAAVALLGAAVAGLQWARDVRYPVAGSAPNDLYVTSPAVSQRLALSFDAIVSDIYWMRAIQYYGGTRLSQDPGKNYDLLYPLLHLTTSLDPHFSIAYRFGAFFLSEEHPGGAGRPDLAIQLLDKAMEMYPDRWEYPHDVAFVHYRTRDYRAAAQWFERAADKPDAPVWLRPLVAAVLATGGDSTSARLVWRALLDSEVEFIRREAARRLMQLDAIDQIALLGQRTALFAQRFGGPPRVWSDVIRAGLLSGIPLDPTGAPYVLDPVSGNVTLSRESSLWPLDPPS
jgi:tetratricopeptide (TPR) repeat protein